VAHLQVRGLGTRRVVLARGDQHGLSAHTVNLPHHLLERRLVGREVDTVGTARFRGRQSLPCLGHQLHQTKVIGEPGQSGRAPDLAVRGAHRNPVVVPSVVDRHDTRMHRQHVARQLPAALDDRPAPHAHLDAVREGGPFPGQGRQGLRWVGAELGAGIAHEHDRGALPPAGLELLGVVSRDPEQVGVALVHLRQRARVRPAELHDGECLIVEVTDPEIQLTQREREYHAERCECYPEGRVAFGEHRRGVSRA
jgi:hypothetical protein